VAHLVRDGVKLFFEQAGQGDPPLLLVHGWTCDHSFVAPQFDHLRTRHRVVAVDLRGHGQSDQPKQAYTMAALADDLEWLCRKLDLHRPVVIGHSMGGVIALNLAAREHGLPSAIVTIDSPILPPAETIESVKPFLAALRGPDYRFAQREFVAAMLFGPDDDPARKADIIDRMSAAPQHVMASAFESIFGFDHAAAAAACRVPWLAVYATRIVSDLPRLRQLCPQLIVGQTVGAGHFNQLEVPDQVNAMITRFLAICPSREDNAAEHGRSSS
jgi:pimeloyl-ACP methyl ester carboxylesterase